MKKKIITKQLACVALASITSLCATGCASNSSEYDTDKIVANETELTGKTIYWLGSSVTYGYRSQGISMADYVAANSNAVCKKEAVTGTTLMDVPNNKGDSYVKRLRESETFDKNEKVDAFVCQISTNDCRKDKLDKLGSLTEETSFDLSVFDIKTTLGALEYIIGYVQETWSCPIFLYSGARFENEGYKACSNPSPDAYSKLIDESQKIADKWNAREDCSVSVIDLFNDEEFNSISKEDYKKYMCDPIHPFKAGYQLWWTPEFEEALISGIKK
ncbi:MAG: SGNH/GDSL hydrolase family protein [Bacilli bacterium]|nr:SGNH/GDSL hydrolase family protein [Bacilli bacterium]